MDCAVQTDVTIHPKPASTSRRGSGCLTPPSDPPASPRLASACAKAAFRPMASPSRRARRPADRHDPSLEHRGRRRSRAVARAPRRGREPRGRGRRIGADAPCARRSGAAQPQSRDSRGRCALLRRFGFRREPVLDLLLPGPVDLDRFLGLEIEPGALARAHGLVVPAGGRRGLRGTGSVRRAA